MTDPHDVDKPTLDQRTAALLKAIDKQIAAIDAGIDPQVARALEELLAAGLIVQDGERPDGNGVMRPAYRITDAGRAVLQQ